MVAAAQFHQPAVPRRSRRGAPAAASAKRASGGHGQGAGMCGHGGTGYHSWERQVGCRGSLLGCHRCLLSPANTPQIMQVVARSTGTGCSRLEHHWSSIILLHDPNPWLSSSASRGMLLVGLPSRITSTRVAAGAAAGGRAEGQAAVVALSTFLGCPMACVSATGP